VGLKETEKASSPKIGKKVLPEREERVKWRGEERSVQKGNAGGKGKAKIAKTACSQREYFMLEKGTL